MKRPTILLELTPAEVAVAFVDVGQTPPATTRQRFDNERNSSYLQNDVIDEVQSQMQGYYPNTPDQTLYEKLQVATKQIEMISNPKLSFNI